MICFFCKQDSIIDEGSAQSWKLDCLHCLELNKLIACSFTNYRRFIDHYSSKAEVKKFQAWEMLGASIYFRMLERPDDMFNLSFHLENEETTLVLIGNSDVGIKKIHVFNNLIDINYKNLIEKTKLTLMFS